MELKPLELPILVISLFNGQGGAFRIYDILGIQPLGRVSIENYPPANRVTRTTWLDVVEMHDIERITFDDILALANQFGRCAEVHSYAGFPCIHLSSVRAGRANLEGEGSKLFWTALKVFGWIREVFQSFAKVKECVENVASMDKSARLEISSQLDCVPIKLDPADHLPFSRPRFAWCSEPMEASEGITLFEEQEFVRAYVETTPVQTEQWIRPGWEWPGDDGVTRMPTFMKAIKRTHPPREPAGLARTDWWAQQRWVESDYRYPPYQFKEQFLLKQAGSAPRVLDSSEREILLGYGPGHTKSCLPASSAKQSYERYEDIRCSLCGDSFAISSFAIIGAVLCQDLTPRMTPQQIVDRLGLAPGASAHPSVRAPMTRFLQYSDGVAADTTVEELSQQLGASVNHTGSDVRVLTGQVLNKKVSSHASIKAMWWQWRHLFNLRWTFPAHINSLEMRMIVQAFLWRARNPKAVGKRWLHIEDSMVCLFILSKGRTSSRLLQPLCNQMGAIQLALGVTGLHAHVPSDENPTDAASRL